MKASLIYTFFFTFHCTVHGFQIHKLHGRPSKAPYFVETTPRGESCTKTCKENLFDLLDQCPPNAATPRQLTNDILAAVRMLEDTCPTPEQQVLSTLAGPWELLWTTQDVQQAENKWTAWINPLENQSYSNNPNGIGGRSNPVLPRPLQDRLENAGIIKQQEQNTNNEGSGVAVKSTQTIDLQKQQVINVVSFLVFGKRSSLTVLVDFQPDPTDLRRINVKFQECRVKGAVVNVNIPLGIIGPTGWLRTTYIDDSIRVTRGHKGSVFVLARPSTKRN